MEREREKEREREREKRKREKRKRERKKGKETDLKVWYIALAHRQVWCFANCFREGASERE